MEWTSGNIFIRPMCFERAGDCRDGHTHNFDHTTVFFIGEFEIECTLPNGREVKQRITAPDHRLILADVKHKITALTDGAQAWCVYSHRSPQGDVVQANTGWGSAYV